MLEKSVVSEQDIQAVLREKYRIHEIYRVTALTGGSANCYRIQAAEGEFVLKEFQSKYSVEDVQIEPKITEFVRTHDLPAAKFIQAATGEYAWAYRNRAFHLQRFVEGAIFPQNGAPDWLLRDMPCLLGQLHRVLFGFPHPLTAAFGRSWFNQWDVDESRQQYAILIAAAECLPQGQVREQTLKDLHDKRNLLLKVAQVHINPNRLTQHNSHGDFNILQLIYKSSKIKAIIDFSSACKIPVVWELIRSYTSADSQCAEAAIDIPSLKNYVCTYLEHAPLSRYDLEMMPYLYYFQLARRRYGYREYLITRSENRESLIQFGFWRTNLCRWLEKNAANLSGELSNLAPSI